MIYNNIKEVESVTELEQIISNQDSMQMQALLVTERILGPTNPYTNFTILFIGDRYRLTGNLNHCIAL